MGELDVRNGGPAAPKTNPQGYPPGLVNSLSSWIAVVVVVGLAVFAIWSWAQHNAVEHPDGYGLAGEVHPARGEAVPIGPVDARYCPSSFCGTAGTLDDRYGAAVTGWAGKYTGKRGNCLHNELQSGVWLRLLGGGTSSGETHTLWVPYECVNWTDSQGHDVTFSTPGGGPG